MKIRSDFVTNSSSSSFVAYGILSKELVDFLKEVVGDYSAACPWQPAEMTWEWDTVNITTEMYDAAESECFLADREDGKRHLSRHEKDKRAASKADVLMKAIQRCVDEVRITEEQKKQIQQLVEQAVAEGRVVCNTYADETDGWVLFNFSRDDFLNAGCIKKDRNGKVVGFDDRGGEPRTWRFTCTSVTGGLFRWCHNTEEIVVEGGSVEPEAFAGCDSLKRLDMSAMKEHDAVASMCEGCTALESVRLPIYAGRIEECAFAGCEKLRDIQIPSSVFYIHPTAFEGCRSLPEETRRVIASLTREKSLDECEAETLHYIQTHGMANFGVEDGYYRSRLGRMKRLLETWWAVYGPELDWPEMLPSEATYSVYAEKDIQIDPPNPQWQMQKTIGKKMRYMIVDTENIPEFMIFEKNYVFPRAEGALRRTRLDKAVELKKQGSGIQILTRAHFEKLVAESAFVELDPKALASQRPKARKEEQRREEDPALVEQQEKLRQQKATLEDERNKRIERFNREIDQAIAAAMAVGRAVGDDANMKLWMDIYGGFVDQVSSIEFNGKLFVFTGFDERNLKLIDAVLERGGQKRKSVSGRTDYLVINPMGASDGKIEDAIAQKAKGSGIQVVTVDMLRAALEGKDIPVVYKPMRQPDVKNEEKPVVGDSVTQAAPAEVEDEQYVEKSDQPTESPEEKRAEAAEAAKALREALAQEAQQLREQMEALYEQKQQAIKVAEEARKREAEEAERRRREAEALAEQKRRGEAAAAERRRQAAAREAEERKRREAEELAARKRREAAAREQELEREKSQLHAQREALQKERDAIKGLFAKARKAKLEPQIAEIETKLAQMEEELKTLRAMKR